jgi:aryl carrier-like protein
MMLVILHTDISDPSIRVYKFKGSALDLVEDLIYKLDGINIVQYEEDYKREGVRVVLETRWDTLVEHPKDLMCSYIKNGVFIVSGKESGVNHFYLSVFCGKFRKFQYDDREIHLLFSKRDGLYYGFYDKDLKWRKFIILRVRELRQIYDFEEFLGKVSSKFRDALEYEIAIEE